jgi:large subunit ribosomal protein L24
MKEFSTIWKRSKKPRKQRKYRYNAPLHIKGKFMHAHLSKELRQKYGTRSLRVRVSDKVKVLRGQYKGLVGKVEKVNLAYNYIYVEKAEFTKKDGTTLKYPINPSNVVILDIETDDKTRKKILERKQKEKSEAGK